MEILNSHLIKPNTCYLYHIRHSLDQGDLTKGYIGVSNQPVTRLKSHIRNPNEKLKCEITNTHVKCELITCGSEDEMLRLENHLRPKPKQWA